MGNYIWSKEGLNSVVEWAKILRSIELETKPDTLKQGENMFVIMNSKEENYGIVGVQTNLFDSEGIQLTVGDLVDLKSSKGDNHGTSFVCCRDGEFFVMGIRCDCYGGRVHEWEVTINTKASDICEGTFDSKGLFVAFLDDKTDKPPVIEAIKPKQNLQYIFAFKDLTSNKDKQIIREHVKNIDESSIAIIDPVMFKSAKLINKMTGEITDLLN